MWQYKACLQPIFVRKLKIQKYESMFMCIGKDQAATLLDPCVAYFGFLIVLPSGDLAILASWSYF